MLYILFRSGTWAWGTGAKPKHLNSDEKGMTTLRNFDSAIESALLRQFALPQLVLAILALTSYHVQIITRLSSGYPVWYWWLASMVLNDREVWSGKRKWKPAIIITRWMVIYGIVQGGLFASFLPPA